LLVMALDRERSLTVPLGSPLGFLLDRARLFQSLVQSAQSPAPILPLVPALVLRLPARLALVLVPEFPLVPALEHQLLAALALVLEVRSQRQQLLPAR
jgi:hypothetical protein